MTNKIFQGNNLDILKTLPDDSIDCCVTSPPYYGLRDYKTANWEGGNSDCNHMRDNKGGKNCFGRVTYGVFTGICKKCGAKRIDQQIGLENTPEEYVNKLCDLFEEVKRVLKSEGTCFVNLGDSYSSDKCLLQIPSRFAIEMTNRGWILRNKIIWYKRNAMPQSVQDRFTVDFEEIFFLVKSKKYYFDQDSVKEEATSTDNTFRNRDDTRLNNTPGRTKMGGLVHNNYTTKNKRCVWDIPTKPFTEAHFAVFPEELIETPIKAGCPENGLILDPFMGSGTTAIVALKNNRNYVGCELNPEYIQIAENRILKYKQNKIPSIQFKERK
jgi:site-specific DNA-methyltransferase (adenine-specific)